MGFADFLGGIPGFEYGQTTSRMNRSTDTFVDPNQQGYLNFLRNMALGQAQGAMGQQGALQGVSQQLLGQGQQFLGNLQGIGGPEMQAQQLRNVLIVFDHQDSFRHFGLN